MENAKWANKVKEWSIGVMRTWMNWINIFMYPLFQMVSKGWLPSWCPRDTTATSISVSEFSRLQISAFGSWFVLPSDFNSLMQSTFENTCKNKWNPNFIYHKSVWPKKKIVLTLPCCHFSYDDIDGWTPLMFALFSLPSRGPERLIDHVSMQSHCRGAEYYQWCKYPSG